MFLFSFNNSHCPALFYNTKKKIFNDIFFYFLERNVRRKLNELKINIYDERNIISKIKRIEIENEIISKFNGAVATNNLVNIIISVFTSFITTFITASVTIVATLSTVLMQKDKTENINTKPLFDNIISNLWEITLYALIITLILSWLASMLLSIRDEIKKLDYSTNLILINILRRHNGNSD